MNAFTKTIIAGVITAAIVTAGNGIFERLDSLQKNQNDMRERLVRIETKLSPEPHVQFSKQ